MATPTLSAVRSLQQEMKKIQEEPVEGFTVRLPDDSDIFLWEVAIFGPPETLYEGGYFKALMKFPPDYPYSPPSVKFLTKMWHPNIYENGEVCISILHPPTDDPLSGELASERWNPTQNVRTILMSIISLLNEPNTSSPANVDASVSYRNWRDTKGQNNDYETVIRKQVQATKIDAAKDSVTVPTTLQEYCVMSRPRPPAASENLTDLDFYDDEDYVDEDDDDVNEEATCNNEEDSGNSDS